MWNMFTNAMKKKAVFMLACLPYVAAFVAMRHVNVVWMWHVVVAPRRLQI
ncbi:unnamed protein product [Lathyrus oleraceus]